jgi:hypothetical protein
MRYLLADYNHLGSVEKTYIDKPLPSEPGYMVTANYFFNGRPGKYTKEIWFFKLRYDADKMMDEISKCSHVCEVEVGIKEQCLN